MPNTYLSYVLSRSKPFPLPKPYLIPGYHSVSSFVHTHSKSLSLTTAPISDHTRENTFDCDYSLVDGYIFIRSLTPDNPRTFVEGDLVYDKKALQWDLFEGLGIPFDKHRHSLLEPGEKIVEFSVASSVLVAVSNLHRVFMYKPTILTRPVYWENFLGSPDVVSENALYLPSTRRAWAFSCSLRTKLKRKTDFINPREIVTYFYDANGIPFDFGFTATIYVLLNDGQRIVYWDTGLPPSFSRGFLVPDGTQGQSISVAGSTVFLSAVDSEGRLRFFTRMIDYEINGACPGLNVSYVDIPKSEPPEKSFPLGMGVRKMPLQGWVEQNTELIHPYLTHKLNIRLIGQGDESRTLKIQGHHPEQGWGFYFKNIFEPNWQFCPASSLKPIPRVDYNFDHTLLSPFKNYACVTRIGVPDGVTLELKGFHPLLTDSDPCYLMINAVDCSTPQFLRMHIVDAWGLHYHQKGDEDLIGNIDGEAKALLGTLVLNAEQIALAQSCSSLLGCYLEKHFLPYHGKTKALRLTADNQTVILHFDCTHTLMFCRHVTEKEFEFSFYTKAIMQPHLLISPRTKEERNSLITQNQLCLQHIQKVFETRKKEDEKFNFLNATARTLRPVAGGFVKIYADQDPTYLPAVRDAENLFKAYKAVVAYEAMKQGFPVGYRRVVAIVEERIMKLRALN